MRFADFIVAVLLLSLTGCDSAAWLFGLSDADGEYEGRINVKVQNPVFNRSFNGTLYISDRGRWAKLKDDYGRTYVADRVDYNYRNDTMAIIFTVTRTRYDSKCGNETWHWRVRMKGRIYSGNRYQGDVEIDIDPWDYYSEHCKLNNDPPPKYIGTFDMRRVSNYDW